MRMYFWVILLSLLIFSERALAYVVTTNAEYKPMPYDVGKSEFKMTDKCAPTVGGFPPAFQCQGGFSRLVHIPNTALKRLLAYSVHINERAIYFRISGEKTVQLKHVKSGVLHTMKFRLTHVGSHAFQDPDYGGVNNYTYNGCSSIHQFINWVGGVRIKHSSISMKKFKKVVVNVIRLVGRSGLIRRRSVLSIYISHMYLPPPSPLLMENGLYRGSLRLTIGDSTKDVSLGWNDPAVSDVIDFNFNFTVKHQLKVDFPAGSGNVVLTPPGGWGDLLYGRGKHAPDSLENVLPARIWSAVPYNMYLICQYMNDAGDKCQLKNQRYDHKASIQVYGTDNDNRSWLLRPDASRHFNTSSSIILDASRPFKFKVLKADVAEMMDYPGSTYKGNITLVIDANI